MLFLLYYSEQCWEQAWHHLGDLIDVPTFSLCFQVEIWGPGGKEMFF